MHTAMKEALLRARVNEGPMSTSLHALLVGDIFRQEVLSINDQGGL